MQNNILLRNICFCRAHKIYGDKIPQRILIRMENELNIIKANEMAAVYITARDLVKESNKAGYIVGYRSGLGSSLVAFLAEITEVNPMSPHYLCNKCHYVDFDSEFVMQYRGTAGCDMPNTICPICGNILTGMGFDLHIETFFGIDGKSEEWFYLNFSKDFIDSIPTTNNNVIKAKLHNNDAKKIYTFYHNDLTILHLLSEYSGIEAKAIPLNDTRVLSLFYSTDEMKIINNYKSELDCGTLGLIDVGRDYLYEIAKKVEPKSFDDLICLFGVGNACSKYSFNQKKFKFFYTTDNVVNYLSKIGISKKDSYRILSSTHNLPLDLKKELKTKNVPQKYINIFENHYYVPSKAFAISLALEAYRKAFYKLYFPMEFYKASLQVGKKYFDDLEYKDISNMSIVQLKNQIVHLTSNKEEIEKNDYEMIVSKYDSEEKIFQELFTCDNKRSTRRLLMRLTYEMKIRGYNI